MFPKARRRRCRRRALCCFALLLGTAAAYGQYLDCEAVPEADQRLCWMVSGCAALGESSARDSCLEALAERQGVALAEIEALLSAGPPAQLTKPLVAERAAPSAAPVPELEPAPTPPRTPPARAEAEPTPRLMSRVLQRLRRPGSKPAPASPPTPSPVPEPVQAPSPTAAQAPAPEPARLPPPTPAPLPVVPTAKSVGVPDRFEAEVTMVRSLIHNRQLIALDNGLLFESDRARQSHIEVGDQVRVKRASSRFGRRYQIAGPVRGAVSAIRLRCENAEASKDTRRKCALLRERGAGSEG